MSQQYNRQNMRINEKYRELHRAFLTVRKVEYLHSMDLKLFVYHSGKIGRIK